MTGIQESISFRKLGANDKNQKTDKIPARGVSS